MRNCHEENLKSAHQATLIAILATLLLLSSVPGIATTYFVSTTGNDYNDGLSPATAWATIDRGDALQILNPGDLVLVSAGTYPQSSANGVQLLNRSGAAGLPITYQATGQVVIDQYAYSGVLNNGMLINVSYIVVDGFEIKRCQNGIYLCGGPSSAVHDDWIKNCVIHDCVAPSPNNPDMFLSLSSGIYNSWE